MLGPGGFIVLQVHSDHGFLQLLGPPTVARYDMASRGRYILLKLLTVKLIINLSDCIYIQGVIIISLDQKAENLPLGFLFHESFCNRGPKVRR